MSLQIDNSFAMTNANTSTTNFNIYHSEESASLDTSKVISFALSVIVGITSIDLPIDGIINLDNSINNHLNMEFTNVLDSNSAKQFRNVNQSTEVYSYSNETLGVEDLAEKVTQAQIDEIKNHFDTKINSLEAILTSTFDSKLTASETKIIKSIDEGKKEAVNKRWVVIGFAVSTIVGPIIVNWVTQVFF